MTDRPIPLSILDLSPIRAGGTAGEALRNSIDLARRAEAAGYARFWVAEHHFAPGVASSAPPVLIGSIAQSTRAIRVGAAAVQTGHQTPLAIVEQFGILDALFPGRLDLGLGRSGQRREEAVAELERGEVERVTETRVVDGLLIPPPYSFAALAGSPRLRYLFSHLQQPGACTPSYDAQLDEILGLLDGTLRTPDGDRVTATPGTGADVEVWVFGSSGGSSARAAGERGLPFGANYHVSPATVLDAVTAYRDSFVASARLDRPHVSVSADVVVAADEATARRLAAPYGLWVRSIRTGLGAIPFPTPDEAAVHPWTDADRQLVDDRLATQFVGTAAQVADQLEVLASVTGADEVVVTTITHDHEDRVRSLDLLAEEWHDRQPTASVAEGALR